MSIPPIVDITIGLVLVYLVLSLLSTSINEAIAGFLRLRGKVLFHEINKILDDAQVRDGFWASGLMRSFSRPSTAQHISAKTAPSYVEAHMFSKALVSTLAKTGDAKGQKPSELLQGLGKGTGLEDVLKQIALDADNKLELFHSGIEAWFNAVMDRASGVYKRHLTVVSGLSAALIVVMADADTLEISKSIWQDDALRQAVVEKAQAVLSNATVSETGAVPTVDATALSNTFSTLMPHPLGWSGNGCMTTACLGDYDFQDWLAKVFGWILSTLAVMLGAPFWFDRLQQLVPLRTSGPLRGTPTHQNVSPHGAP